MKTQLPIFALVAGAFAAYLVLVFAMVGPSVSYVLFPTSIGVSASIVLTAIDPEKWKWTAFYIALPTVAMSLLFGIGEIWGDGDWHWLVVAVIALVVCGVPAWLAHN